MIFAQINALLLGSATPTEQSAPPIWSIEVERDVYFVRRVCAIVNNPIVKMVKENIRESLLFRRKCSEIVSSNSGCSIRRNTKDGFNKDNVATRPRYPYAFFKKCHWIVSMVQDSE